MILEFKRNDEEGRARALERYNILDTATEASFEHVVSMVQDVLKVPMCAVSLVDRSRLWFKAYRNLPVDQIPRQNSFCGETIEGTEPLIVADARNDPRFFKSATVTGAPFIRSYAGIPLQSPDGYNIGALCAMDTKCREFRPNEINILNNFAKIVLDELDKRQAAFSGHVTEVLSRKGWLGKAEQEIERSIRANLPVSVAMLDIDRFRRVNDTFGHPAGDLVIRDIADLCVKTIRETDFCGRLGGEEFAVMMPDTELATANTVGERIRARIEQELIDIGGTEPLSCTVSVGVSELAEDDIALAPILTRAERALYHAKTYGRNRVEAA